MAHTLVTFHAHPDDESLLTAGVMAKAAAEGHRVVLVVATSGEVGEVADDFLAGDDLAQVRNAETLCSAEALGVHRVEFLGYRDSGIPGDKTDATDHPDAFTNANVEDAAAKLAEILTEEQADVLTVYDRHGGYGHPDHLQVHHVGIRAAELAGTPVVLEATINRDLMKMGVQMVQSMGIEVPEEFAPPDFDRANWFLPADELTTAVDVSEFLDHKRKSMEAHASQATSATSGTRSLSVFVSLPDQFFAMAFGTEWFVRRGRPAGIDEDDVFAAVAGG